MVEHKLVSFAAVVALWTLVTLLIKLIRILLKWKYIRTRQKVCHFWRYVGKAKPFCQESFVPVTRAGWSVHMGKFSSRSPRSRSLKPRSRQRVSPASLINTSKFLQRKEWRGEIPETKPARLTELISPGYWNKTFSTVHDPTRFHTCSSYTSGSWMCVYSVL